MRRWPKGITSSGKAEQFVFSNSMPAHFFRNFALVLFSVFALLTFATAQRQVRAATQPRVCNPAASPLTCPTPGTGSPTLSSVSPASIAQGVQQARLTIMGANFRPGAQLVIGGLGGSSNVSVNSATVVSTNVIVAYVSVSPQASTNAISVDVMNSDGTSTFRSGSTRSLFITPANSLASSLQIQTIVVTGPRDGSLITQGTEVHATAILGGAGTGTISGEWLWDNLVTEQFTLNMVGGQRALLSTLNSLPTYQIGQHTVSLRVTSPGSLQTKPILVMVTPSFDDVSSSAGSTAAWQELRLLSPRPASRFAADAPPKLQWTIVPGADKYQVGFASRPYFNSVAQWYDVRDTSWQVPAEVWTKVPSSALYWTVRSVDISGQTRKPSPLRRLYRTPKDALTAIASEPGRSRTGSLLLAWRPLEDSALYSVTIGLDPDFGRVLRRYVTTKTNADLQLIQPQMQPGRVYYWRVDALAGNGQRVLIGPTYSFLAPAAPRATRSRAQPYLVASMANPPAPPSLADLIVSRTPAPNQAVMGSNPRMTVEFKPGTVLETFALSIDDTDVSAMLMTEGTKVTYNPVIPFGPGDHTVTVTLGAGTESWTFKIASTSVAAVAPAPARTSTDAEPEPAAPPVVATAPAAVAPAASGTAQPAGATAAAQPAAKPLGPHVITKLGVNTQWASGSSPDSSVMNAAQQLSATYGKWKFEVNGSGLTNAQHTPGPQHVIGHFTDNYVSRATYEQKTWGSDVKFGVLAPSVYAGSEFVTPGSARQGVEPMLRTKAGTLGFFANTEDYSIGSGAGLSFKQRLLGAAYIAPLPTKRAEFRFMWLSARDNGTPQGSGFVGTDASGNPVVLPQAKPSSGQMYGGLFRLNLTSVWAWSSEYAWSYNHADLTRTDLPSTFGRAWRSGLQGTLWQTTIKVGFRDVAPNFSTPANPSLTPLGTPDRRGWDLSLSRSVKTKTFDYGTFTFNYQFAQTSSRSLTTPELDLDSITAGWTKQLKRGTNISIQFRDTLNSTGYLPAAFLALPVDQQKGALADNRDLGGDLTVSHNFKKLSLNFATGRDWLRNTLNPQQNVITSKIGGGATWNLVSYFKLQSNLSVNYVHADPLTVGISRVVTTLIQPVLEWKKKGLQFGPTLSLAKTDGALRIGTVLADQFNSQYSGRVSWQMPGKFKFSVISIEGGETRVRDVVQNTYKTDPRIVFQWALNWGYDRQMGAPKPTKAQ